MPGALAKIGVCVIFCKYAVLRFFVPFLVQSFQSTSGLVTRGNILRRQKMKKKIEGLALKNAEINMWVEQGPPGWRIEVTIKGYIGEIFDSKEKALECIPLITSQISQIIS